MRVHEDLPSLGQEKTANRSALSPTRFGEGGTARLCHTRTLLLGVPLRAARLTPRVERERVHESTSLE